MHLLPLFLALHHTFLHTMKEYCHLASFVIAALGILVFRHNRCKRYQYTIYRGLLN